MKVQGGIETDGIKLQGWPTGTLIRPLGQQIQFLQMAVCIGSHPAICCTRQRVARTDMNAGFTLVAATPGLRYRMVDVKQISIGGAMAATANATGTAIYGTQAGSTIALYTVLLAAGTENTTCQLGTGNTSVLDAGASYAVLDPNTAITCRAISAGNYNLITATYYDIVLQYIVGL